MNDRNRIDSQEYAVEINGVSYQYENAKKECIKNVTLRIHKGECVLLCGKSGCGKTTVTKLINGLIPYCENGKKTGRVLVSGMELDKEPLYEISKHVASVFQNPKSQFFNVEAESEIAFALENENMPVEQISERVEHVVKELGINELIKKNLFQMSGGEKQIIAIASAYASNAEIVVLDEPSANLDIETIEKITGILKRIKQAGKTIIIAEHRLSYLNSIADTICYFDQENGMQSYTNKEFYKITEEERKRMGLRNLDCEHIFSCKNQNVQTSQKNLLELKRIVMSFKKTVLYTNLSFQLYSGEIVALTGRNGMGKSTLSRIICGLEKHNQGCVSWNGKVLSPKKRKEISYILMQDVNHQLFAESVEEECFLGNEEVRRTEIDKILSALSLSEQSKMHPQCLSGGQKQRLAAAVALLAKRDILLFDEPTSGLDYCNMRTVGQILRKLANQNKVILVVTHDCEFIEEVCDKCFCLTKDSIEDISRNIKLC